MVSATTPLTHLPIHTPQHPSLATPPLPPCCTGLKCHKPASFVLRSLTTLASDADVFVLTEGPYYSTYCACLQAYADNVAVGVEGAAGEGAAEGEDGAEARAAPRARAALRGGCRDV